MTADERMIQTGMIAAAETLDVGRGAWAETGEGKSPLGSFCTDKS
jgi:hypothetical protein